MALASCALGVLAAACGTTPSLSADQYEAAFRDARCSFLVRCGELESAEICRTTNIGADTRLTASERAAIDQGKAHYDGVAAQRCRDALAARSCDVTSQANRAIAADCVAILHGTLDSAGSCAIDAECVSQRCDATRCTNGCCAGTCTGDPAPRLAKLGEACDDHVPCAPGGACDGQSCVALKPATSKCVFSSECAYGLDCDPATQTCLALPGPGASCTGACRDEGTTCSPTSQTCVRVALAGEACATSADCSKFYRCDATKHCTAGVPLDGMCSASLRCAGDRAFCQIPDGLSMGTCVAPQPEGMPCQSNANCESRTCDPLTLRCIAEPVCT